MGALMTMDPSLGEAYPKIAAFLASIMALPKIKAYLDARPKCPF